MTASLHAGFRDRSTFAPRAYRLLPFRFTRLDDARYVATNDVGEHIVVRRDELTALVRHELSLLRAEQDVIEELLGGPAKGDGAPRIDLHGTDAYLALDAAHRCVGIYAVGATSGHRALSSTEWTTDRLLSQAVGKPVKVHLPTQSSGTLQWYEGGYPIMARWSAGQLLELRIGAATP